MSSWLLDKSIPLGAYKMLGVEIWIFATRTFFAWLFAKILFSAHIFVQDDRIFQQWIGMLEFVLYINVLWKVSAFQSSIRFKK
jgi:hypothetical protein